MQPAFVVAAGLLAGSAALLVPGGCRRESHGDVAKPSGPAPRQKVPERAKSKGGVSPPHHGHPPCERARHLGGPCVRAADGNEERVTRRASTPRGGPNAASSERSTGVLDESATPSAP
jgi:hypothetical protein